MIRAIGKLAVVYGALAGCVRNDLIDIDSPAHYAMHVHEVTVAEYRRCVTAGVCKRPVRIRMPVGRSWRMVLTRDDRMCNRIGRSRHPVNCVTVDMARTYCAWVGMRLPTQEEWNWAAQSGAEHRAYPWGEQEPSCDVTVMEGVRIGEDLNLGCGHDGTAPVMSQPSDVTADGIWDMGGNVSEFAEGQEGPLVMGGSFAEMSPKEFSAQYPGTAVVDPFNTTGFRCASVM